MRERKFRPTGRIETTQYPSWEKRYYRVVLKKLTSWQWIKSRVRMNVYQQEIWDILSDQPKRKALSLAQIRNKMPATLQDRRKILLAVRSLSMKGFIEKV